MKPLNQTNQTYVKADSKERTNILKNLLKDFRFEYYLSEISEEVSNTEFCNTYVGTFAIQCSERERSMLLTIYGLKCQKLR